LPPFNNQVDLIDTSHVTSVDEGITLDVTVVDTSDNVDVVSAHIETVKETEAESDLSKADKNAKDLIVDEVIALPVVVLDDSEPKEVENPLTTSNQ